jgi:hypothetical protein
MHKKRAIPAAVIAIILVLLIPLAIPSLFVVGFILERRRSRDAEKTLCMNCGKLLGAESLKRSNEFWREHVRRLRLAHPGSKLRLVRTNWAICTNCNSAYTYRERTRSFKLLGPRALP